MKKKNKISPMALLILVLLLALIFTIIYFSKKDAVYKERLAKEQLTTVDFYSMQEYSSRNSKAVMDALKSGSTKNLEHLMIDPAGAESVMLFAEWMNADFDNAVSMGAGSLTPAPDENGKMDISERFIVNVGEVKYVLFVETLTSRWGMNNDGVSAVSVTTFGHFDGTDYTWNGEADDQSALAGALWWNKEAEQKEEQKEEKKD